MSKASFISIYKAYRTKIYFYLCKKIGIADADDLTQEVFVKVHNGLENFHFKSSIATWIYKIAENTVCDYLRRSVSRNDAGFTEIEGDESDSLQETDDADGELQHSTLVKKEMGECIQKIIGQIPGHYQLPLILSDIEGLSNDEIAKICNISLTNVKIRLHRARNLLRKEMNNRCDVYCNSNNDLACDPKATTFQ